MVKFSSLAARVILYPVLPPPFVINYLWKSISLSRHLLFNCVKSCFDSHMLLVSHCAAKLLCLSCFRLFVGKS